jgi:DNA-binding IclR family transcriptional regulator
MSVDDVDRLAGRDDDSRPSASVLLNGLRVLESFTITEPVLGVTEIARKVDLHKSSVSRILATLEKAGYVERDDGSGRFRLGLGLIALTGPLLANLDVRRVAQPELVELTQRTGETSALAVWNGHESVVVEQVPSPKQVKHSASVGTRYDTYQSSSVQVFLSEMPRADVLNLFTRRLLVGPDGTRAVDAYVAELTEARARGYALNDGRTSIEEVGVAAPIHDHRGVLVAAVLLSAPRFRVPQAMLEPLGHAVVETARNVSARLGGAPAPAVASG